MSKVDLKSREWCELVFEGRNKAYGAYDLRSKAGRRHLYALIDIIIGIIAIGCIVAGTIAAKEALSASMAEGDAVTELSELKKDEPKKEEKKVEVKQEEIPQKQEVLVKSSIQFTVPEIVDQVDESKKMKTQDELQHTNVAISSITIEGNSDHGINVEDLRDNQVMGNGEAKPVASSAVVEEEAKVYNVVEQPPTFPGGEAALLKYIATHVKYPQIAQEQEIQGVVNLRFVVKEDGSVGDVQVAKSLESHCDQEAVRVVKSLPRFIPGKQQGKAVKVWFSLPVRFQLQ
ncbi:MAG: energy transducer TonB [Bacteroidales bacterium]|nr:energy transducer TonB [Bacteroidales bacterium]